ncbi:MAG: SAM-dependent methyltransferase [Cytophagales bacterium]|nr:SAM-dependent methyltransferase [Bernardetiaceae bacterium]MDW8210234.1 SAM-dependent methyltransferase [Cytophagales bacterium]
MSALYLIPLPIADLQNAHEFILPQVRQVIATTDYYLVENLRTARRFIAWLKTGRSIDALHFFLLNKNTSSEEVASYFQQIPPQASVGLMSEAGCPGIADPGQWAVKYAHQTGRRVVPLVGPSSIVLALMASGLNGQQFVFHGYLPVARQERISALRRLEKEALQGITQIFIEAPHRNDHIIEDMLAHLRPHTLLCIAAQLTAPEELICTKTISQWQAQKPHLGKVPAVFLLGTW